MQKRKRINNKIDLGILILFFLLGLYFIVEAILGSLIPFKYILIILLMNILLFVGIFLTFKVRNQTFRIVRRCFTGFLCVLFLLGSIFQGQVRNAFSNVKGSTSSEYMVVITHKDANIDKLDEIDILGYVEETSELLLYSLDQLSGFKRLGLESVQTGFELLDNQVIDGYLISEKDLSFYEGELKNYRKVHEIEMVKTEEVIHSDLFEKPFVVYLSGLDQMGYPTKNGLHDVNMLLMVNPEAHSVNVISINRDSYVPNARYNDYPDKLTHLGWYGPDVACETLERVFGIEIDYYAKVTFESLIKIIDAMGGIDVDVKLSFTEQDENRSFADADLIHLEKGFQHLNGSQALAYARHRKTAGWGVEGREQAQRDIIQAVISKMLSVEGAMKLGDVLNTGASYVSTNLSMDSAKQFVKEAINDGKGWSIRSFSVTSNKEVKLKCAMEGGVQRSVNVMEERDIYAVHNLYTSMFEESDLSQIEFDLNDLNSNIEGFTLDKHVITVENYYNVVSEYFNEYLESRF